MRKAFFYPAIGGVLKNLIKKLPWGIPGGKVPVNPIPISGAYGKYIYVSRTNTLNDIQGGDCLT